MTHRELINLVEGANFRERQSWAKIYAVWRTQVVDAPSFEQFIGEDTPAADDSS